MSLSAGELIQMMGGIQGIDWAELERRGKNDIFMPEYILEYLLPAYGRALNVFKTLDFMPETDAELIDRYAQIKSSLSDPLAFAEQAFRANIASVLPGQGLGMSSAEMQSFVYYLWLTTTNGTYMHHKVLIHYAVAAEQGGKLNDDGVQQIADHADWIAMMCNAVVKLDSMGTFKAIKKPGFGGTNYVGVGVLPVVAIVVIAVAAIAAIAFLLLGIVQVTQREKTVNAVCTDATRSRDPSALDLCKDLAKQTPPPSGSDMLNKVIIIASIAIGGYALLLFGPILAQSLKSRQKAAA